MKKFLPAILGMAVLLTPLLATTNEASADFKVKKVCKSGVCGQAFYDGQSVYIKLSHKLSRATHYNFKTNPGDQIEILGKYSFDRDAGESGTYSAQACDRGGIGARSTCTKWATFDWSSGEEDLDED